MISVVLNGYKRAEYLDLQIKSIKEQSVKVKEILIWQNYYKNFNNKAIYGVNYVNEILYKSTQLLKNAAISVEDKDKRIIDLQDKLNKCSNNDVTTNSEILLANLQNIAKLFPPLPTLL